jgi:hypothetical protein
MSAEYDAFDEVYRHPGGALRQGTVYVLHFEWDVSEDWWMEDEQHYIGWTGDLGTRLKRHVTLASGSTFTMSRVYYGRRFVLGAAFPGTVEDEKQLQAENAGGRRTCELCRLWSSGAQEEALREVDRRLTALAPHAATPRD